MKIGVDIDNVVYNTTQVILDIHYENTGERLNINDIQSYDISEYVSDKYKKDFYKIFLDKRVLKRVQLLPDCVETIKQLHDMGYEIYFVTAADIANIHKKYRFLCRTFPFIDVRKRLITTQKKQMIKVDVLIDDCAENLIGGEYFGVLFNYPWNQYLSSINSVRVNGWNEVIDKIKEL